MFALFVAGYFKLLSVAMQVDLADMQEMASLPTADHAFYDSSWDTSSFVASINSQICTDLRCAAVSWTPEGVHAFSLDLE